MKKLSNTEAELKKTLLIKKRASQYSAASFKDLETTSKLEPSQGGIYHQLLHAQLRGSRSIKVKAYAKGW